MHSGIEAHLGFASLKFKKKKKKKITSIDIGTTFSNFVI